MSLTPPSTPPSLVPSVIVSAPSRTSPLPPIPPTPRLHSVLPVLSAISSEAALEAALLSIAPLSQHELIKNTILDSHNETDWMHLASKVSIDLALNISSWLVMGVLRHYGRFTTRRATVIYGAGYIAPFFFPGLDGGVAAAAADVEKVEAEKAKA
ncbi:hypothetical protein LTR16_007464 [Cryomyces antarcticus]|uniref:DUF2470 domain-containing protein n=1 Tax=Cryomyces antarcticus TaxID=329879 RepID=A0ABR0M407_9PEZI|nr:hypothetical protein LTR04_000330 [Oleoguttula sp. CCFEE 6159]KAK5279698.1 hypothetical protein LTR16_007464 [Cryomyces antarcticus]